jgi:hypothetical protein
LPIAWKEPNVPVGVDLIDRGGKGKHMCIPKGGAREEEVFFAPLCRKPRFGV